MASKFDTNTKILLISEIRNRPFLWQTSHPDYKRKDRTVLAWAQISDLFNQDVQTCKEAWRSLYDQWRKKNYQILRAQQAGVDIASAEKGVFYEMLNFLKDRNSDLPENDFTTLTDDDKEFESLVEPDVLPSTSNISENSDASTVIAFELIDAIRSIKESFLSHKTPFSSCKQDQDDGLDDFCRFIYKKMRLMPPNIRAECEKRVLNVALECEKEAALSSTINVDLDNFSPEKSANNNS